MFKKLGIFLFAAFAFGLTSCEEDWVEPLPQSNPQEPTMSLDGLSVDFGSALKGAIDLNTSDSIEVITTLATPKLRDGQSVEYVMYVSKNADFSDSRSIDVTNGKVPTSALNINYRELFGKAPKANDMYFRFAAFLAYADGASVRFGDTNTFFAQTEALSVTPIPEAFTVEEAYYLIGDMNSWNNNDPLLFNHSDMDVYDDPIFTINVQVGDNCYWKIMPKSTVGTWNGLLGVEVDGDESTEGDLIVGGNAGKIAKAGWYRFTINLMDNKYTIEALGDPYLYIIGSNNGWDITNGDYFLSSPNYDNVYSGVAKMPGSSYFRFYSALGAWGIGSNGSDADGSVNHDVVFDGGVYKADIIQDGQGCWVIADEGAYYMQADLNNFTLYLNKLDAKQVYLMGNCNGWNVEDASCALINDNPSSSNYAYGAEIDMKDSGDGYCYFRINTALSWTSQFGSVSGGNENMNVAGGSAKTKIKPGSEGCFVLPAGMYYIEVDFVNGTIEAIAI